MRDFILLFVNGREYRVTGADAFLTLSTFLRDRLRMCGTKNVCNEGDCGSCSTLCGQIDSASKPSASKASTSEPSSNQTIQYHTIDSCIRFVFQLDGCHVVTVEGLAGGCHGSGHATDTASLSPVQQAMVDCHGSQCGFCTPGFVVAMTGVLESASSPSIDHWRTELSGNLCRCTGYTPILSAALDSAKHYSPQHTLGARYDAGPMVATWSKYQNESVAIQATTGRGHNVAVACPHDLDGALDFLAESPDATMVAGATELGVRFNKSTLNDQSGSSVKAWLDLNRVDALSGCHIEETAEGSQLVLGGRATWAQMRETIRDRVPAFDDIVKIFGSPQIRNVGTIGGNIVNASPIADSLPFLLVCDAMLTLVSNRGQRDIPIGQFFLGYKKIDLQPGELLQQVRVPLPPTSRDLRLYKVSRRLDMDISTFTAAIWIDRDGDQITDAGIAYGAVGPTVLRMEKTQAFLRGKPFSLETMKAAGQVAVGEISPLSDVRGGADFRLQLARNVLQKFFHEVSRDQVPV